MSGTLGYMDLISMAEANSKSKQKELQRLEHRLNKEKKMDPKQVKLKVGVQKFLEKKEEEERQRKEEANRKREQLMNIRNQDRKATSRVRRMINMTKSANKSVIEDARECLSEACNEQASETQPDEDDYGYTSTYANEMYNKMLEKYQADAKKTSIPCRSKLDGPKIQQIKKSSTEKEPDTGHHHRHNNQSNLENIAKDKDKSKPKKKLPPPPPGYDTLLRLAEEKSKVPIPIMKPTKEALEGPEFEFGRPMTAKEKKIYLQEQELKQRSAAAFAGNAAAKPSSKLGSSIPPVKSVDSFKSKSTTMTIPKMNAPVPKVDVVKPTKPQEAFGAKREINNNSSYQPHVNPSSSLQKHHVKDKPGLENNRKSNGRPTTTTNNQPQPSSAHSEFKNPTSSYNENENRKITKPNGHSSRDAVPAKATRNSSSSSQSSKQRYTDEEDGRIKYQKKVQPSTASYPEKERNSFSPRSRPSDRGKPECHFRPDMPPHRMEKPHRGRQIIESDEEYDSEMDDFIDDSDVPPEDISSMIGQMFNYNKRKYVNEESDDECMESSVAQQMREEAHTLRLGVLEDLEEQRKQEEEDKRKALLRRKRLK